MSSSHRLRVFLCHASADKPTIRELYRRLRDDGFDPWLDEEHLMPGQRWEREILVQRQRQNMGWIVRFCTEKQPQIQLGHPKIKL